MFSKIQVVLVILFYLIINQKYTIILILIFLYLYLNQNVNDLCLIVENDIKQLNEIIDKENLHYYKSFQDLNNLRGKYPIQKIRKEQVKIVNQMLYQVVLDKKQKAYWDSLKQYLLQKP